MADTASTPKPRPEKPDEEKYKVDLAQADKELKAAQEKLVSCSINLEYIPMRLERKNLPNNSTNIYNRMQSMPSLILLNLVIKTHPPPRNNRNSVLSLLPLDSNSLASRTLVPVFRRRLLRLIPS